MVTNYHVIEGASEVKVALADKREFDAEIVLKDEHSDLTVLRLKDANERFPALDFANSDELQVGDVVLAIGDPFGVGQTVTHGIVSAVARTQVGISDYRFFIQTDAAINPGNSGGALVDLNGRLVGINTAIYSRSGGSQGIGFAIPANMVRVVVASAKGGSAAVKRPWLGAKLQEVTPEIAESLGLKRPSGALVASVAADGPAARAGLKTGDLIVSIDGTVVEDPNAFDYRFATKPLGGTAQIGLLAPGQRAGRADRVCRPRPTRRATRSRSGRARRSSAPRSPIFRRRSPTSCGSIRRAEAVVIVGVADGSTAQSIGFQQGDIVVSVNNQNIERRPISSASREPAAGCGASPINRGGQQISDVQWMNELAPEEKPAEPCSPPPARPRRAAPARRQAPAAISLPTSSARITCSGPTARSRACWRRARSAR